MKGLSLRAEKRRQEAGELARLRLRVKELEDANANLRARVEYFERNPFTKGRCDNQAITRGEVFE